MLLYADDFLKIKFNYIGLFVVVANEWDFNWDDKLCILINLNWNKTYFSH